MPGPAAAGTVGSTWALGLRATRGTGGRIGRYAVAGSGCLRLGQAGAGQHDAIVRVAADDKSALRIDYGGSSRIVIRRQELRQAVPPAMPRRPYRVAHAVLDRQLLGRFPAILNEPVECSRHPRGDWFAAQFGIIVKLSKQSVRHGEARRSRVAGVQKAERPVFVSRGRRAGCGELDMIVLAGAFNEDPKLDRVVVDDLRHVVSPGVDEAGPGPGIRPVIDRRESVDSDGRQFFGVPFCAWENERVIDAVSAPHAPRAAGRVVVDGPEAVRARGKRELIDQSR